MNKYTDFFVACVVSIIIIISLFFLHRFQCIQACDYDETKLVTGENLVRHRKKKFAHLSLKHITLLGIVRMKKKEKKQRVSKRAEMTRSEPIRGRSAFLFDEAAVNENDAEEEEGDDDNDEDDEHYENGREDEENVVERGMSESEFDSD